MKYLRRVCALLAAGLGCATCKVDDDVDNRAWACTTNADCGTQDGKSMTCWQHFCMPSCDPEQPAPTGYQCVLPGALLQHCRLGPSGPGCPAHLNCYRTDLLSGSGMCVPTPVCSEDADCVGDPERNTCASTVLATMLPDSIPESLRSPGPLHCIQARCSDRSPCSPEESCLSEHYFLPANFPQVCVPRCDGRGTCPLNHACAEINSATGAQRVCLPGLPGFRCGREEDCLVGSCMATTAGFSVCSMGCTTDADCGLLSETGRYFWCVQGRDEKLCVTPSPFQGTECLPVNEGADCPPEAPQCFEKGPFGLQLHWECRMPCDAGGRCPARGGVPHVCLSSVGGGCYPGSFGVPCLDDAECLPPFSCMEVPLDGFENYPNMEPKRCTVACASHDDCTAVPASEGGGYCGGEHCRLKGNPGRSCAISEHCHSGRCVDGACE